MKILPPLCRSITVTITATIKDILLPDHLRSMMLLLLGGMMTCPADELVTLSGRFRDKAGNPLAGISLVLSGIIEEETLVKYLTTDDEGKFSIEVPSGHWTGIPDEIELLELGYFCLPGFEWEPEIIVDNTGTRPGEIIQFNSPTGMELIAVSITPVLRVIGRDQLDGTVTLTAEFEFGEFQPPFFFANYQLFRSEDLKNWTLFTEIELNNEEATGFADTSPKNVRCFYRAQRRRPIGVNLRERSKCLQGICDLGGHPFRVA